MTMHVECDIDAACLRVEVGVWHDCIHVHGALGSRVRVDPADEFLKVDVILIVPKRTLHLARHRCGRGWARKRSQHNHVEPTLLANGAIEHTRALNPNA